MFYRSPPFALMTVLERGSAGIELITTGLSAEDHVTVPAYTEEHTYAMGYLLTWKIILTFFRAASSEVSDLTFFIPCQRWLAGF